MPLVDASFLVGLLDADDPWHDRAREHAATLLERRPWRIHALALAEVVAIIGSRYGGTEAREAYWMVEDTMELHLPDHHDLDDAMDLVVHYDGSLSLSDTLTLHLMREHGDQVVLSFDSDFDKAGVERLPRTG